MVSVPERWQEFRASVPGKVFVLGEYLAMGGGPAVVATVPQRFELKTSEQGEPVLSLFHPESPAGRWCRRQGGPEFESFEKKYLFVNPYEAGGLGGSTAEFGLVAALSQELKVIDRDLALTLWAQYRALHPGPAPSGSDLLAQLLGGAWVVEWTEGETPQLEDVKSAFTKMKFLLFSGSHLANRKTPTHEHLSQADLMSIWKKEERAFRKCVLLVLGLCMIRMGPVWGGRWWNTRSGFHH